MPEEVLFETERPQSRDEIATYLHQVADKLATNEAITLQSGDQSVTVDPPATATFEVKVEREGSSHENEEMSIEFEIEWDSGTTADADLTID